MAFLIESPVAAAFLRRMPLTRRNGNDTR